MFRGVNRVHFVGIGGIGMSGIAEILLAEGFQVTGSDLAKSEITDHLEKLGATVWQGHSAENVSEAEVVVYSSAVKPDENAETAEATRRKIPLIRRAEMLAEVTRMHYGIAVAGTHGKTTTTSMIGLVTIEGGLDPTVIVGGKLADLGGTNARRGDGEWTVVEADEYDRSFLSLLPTIAVITNLESEHLDIYSGIEDLKRSFAEFANNVPFYGAIILCLDEPNLVDIMPRLARRVVSYGTSIQCDVRATDIHFEEGTTTFRVRRRGEDLGEIRLKVVGVHNVRNALASVTVGLEVGIPFEAIARGLAKFSGVYRRFEVKGEHQGVTVIDDYAHHPTEVRATLEGIRNGWSNKRIVAVFQPHTFTRTRDFHREFGKAFLDADIVIVTDIYPAREQPIQGITGELIAKSAADYGHRDVRFIPHKEDVPEIIADLARPNDIVLTMGAGDIWRIGETILEKLEGKGST